MPLESETHLQMIVSQNDLSKRMAKHPLAPPRGEIRFCHLPTRGALHCGHGVVVRSGMARMKLYACARQLPIRCPLSCHARVLVKSLQRLEQRRIEPYLGNSIFEPT